MGDQQETAALASWSHGILVSSERTTYRSGCVLLLIFFTRCELSWSIEGKVKIIEELQRNTVTILVGETGSGKTTREPGTRISVHFPLIHGKRYPNTSLRQVYQAGNVLQSPSRGESLPHLWQPVLPRSKGFLWARLSGILSVLMSVAAQTRRSNSSRTECWFGN